MLKNLHKLRGLAALAVVFSHIGHWYDFEHLLWISRLVSFGSQAVPVFFVISGFIISRSHRREIGDPGRARDYAIKRIFRLYPCYWAYSLAFAVMGFMGIRSWDASNIERRSTYQLIAGVLLAPMTGAAQGFLGVSWSLFYEVLFYAVFAAFFLGKRIGAIAIFLLMGLSLANHDSRLIHVFCFNRINVLFLAGLLIGFNTNFVTRLRIPWRPLCTVGAISYFAASYFRLSINSPVVYLNAVLLVAAVILADFGSGHLADNTPGLWEKSLLWLGSISYSLYLCHVPVQTLLHAYLGDPGYRPLLLLLYVICPVAAASVTYLAIELPMQRLARRLTHKPPRTIPGVSEVIAQAP